MLPPHILVALAARPLSFCFLLANSFCYPLALQAYIYAFASQHQSLHPKDGDSMVLQNTGITPQHYTASRPRRPRLELQAHVY